MGHVSDLERPRREARQQGRIEEEIVPVDKGHPDGGDSFEATRESAGSVHPSEPRAQNEDIEWTIRRHAGRGSLNPFRLIRI